MKPLSFSKRHALPLGFLLCLCVTAGGCAAGFGTFGYLVYGEDIDPVCKDKMKGKVAIVCRPGRAAVYNHGDVSNQLARALHARMQEKLKKRQKVELISQREIEKYCNNVDASTDFIDIGAEVGADQVIAIDLNSYTHHGGINLMQGRANVTVSLLDVKTGDVVYDALELNEYVFPANGISISEQYEGAFRQKYIQRLALHISKVFVPYSRWDTEY